MTTEPREILKITDLGYRVLRLLKRSKKPASRGWTNTGATNDPAKIRQWVKDKSNFGIPCGKPNQVLCLDFDSIEEARKFYRNHPDACVSIGRSPRGVHVFLRIPAGIDVPSQSFRAQKIDVISDGRQVVIPPSTLEQDDGSIFRYHWIQDHDLKRATDLPVFKWEYLPKKARQLSKRPTNSKVGELDLEERIKRCFKYLLHIESRSGCNGHSSLYRAVCVCRDKFQLPRNETARLLNLWNVSGKAVPPWSAKEIEHKLEDTYRQSPQTPQR